MSEGATSNPQLEPPVPKKDSNLAKPDRPAASLTWREKLAIRKANPPARRKG